MDNYPLLKALHLLGVTLFLGNIIVTAVWKLLADRTRQPAVVAYAQRLVTLTDFVFTAVGVLLIVISGRMMSPQFGAVGEVWWLTMGWGLFIASGIIWALILVPVQIKQARMAKAFANEASIPSRYWSLARVWAVFGIIATLLPLANVYFMVVKPV